MNIDLSVCIPTYNRRIYLKQCLESVLPQANEYKIPIFISDNASNDGTEEVVKEFSREYPLLFYKRQRTNTGIDINMLEVISLSQSKYAWWLGDDDIMIDNGVQYVLEILDKANDVSLMLLNAKHGATKNTTLSTTENIIINDCRDFFKNYCFQMPFGTLIVNTYKLRDVEPRRFIGTSHAYSGVILDYLANEFLNRGENKIVLVAKPIVCLRNGQKTWSNYVAKIQLIEIPEWFDKLNEIYVLEMQKIRKFYLDKQSRLRVFLNYRAKGQIKLSNWHCLSRYTPFVGKFNAIFVSLLPSEVANIISWLRKKIINLIGRGR